jgi:hypothetical protein
LKELGYLLTDGEGTLDADKPMSEQSDNANFSKYFSNVRSDIAWLRRGLKALDAKLADRTAAGTCTRRHIYDASASIRAPSAHLNRADI